MAARQDHVHRGFGSAVPLGVGTTAAGVGAALLAAREDHRHALDDTGWIAPTLVNGWANYGVNWATSGYRRIGPLVVLRGLIKNGTIPGLAFTVPAGYRPAANQERHIATFSNAALGGVRVYNNGEVRVGDPGSNAWFSLDGVYWVAEA